MSPALLADLILLVHLGFILWVTLGGLAVLARPRLAWLHLPCVAWGAAVELFGWVCPLTPLENRYRALAGQAGYGGDFIQHYLTGVIYPEGLTRGVQIALGVGVLLVNAVVYVRLATRRSQFALARFARQQRFVDLGFGHVQARGNPLKMNRQSFLIAAACHGGLEQIAVCASQHVFVSINAASTESKSYM